MTATATGASTEDDLVRSLPPGTSCYELFGLVLAVRGELATALVPSESAPDVIFEIVDRPPVPSEEWGPPLREELGNFALHRVAGVDVLHFIDEAVFFLDDGRILCHLADPSQGYIAEIRLLGGVLAYWLECRGVPALHASAVVVEGRAIAFSSGNGGGKSSVAAELMRKGHRLLTDDILPIDIRSGTPHGRSGYPQMRMWPRDAEHYLGAVEGLQLVHPAFDKLRVPVGAGGFGAFCGQATELGAIYLLHPLDTADPPVFEQVPPAASVVQLAAMSFAAPVSGAAPRRKERFGVLAEVGSRVPIWWLTFGRNASRPESLADVVLRHSDQVQRPPSAGSH